MSYLVEEDESKKLYHLVKENASKRMSHLVGKGLGFTNAFVGAHQNCFMNFRELLRASKALSAFVCFNVSCMFVSFCLFANMIAQAYNVR